MRVTPGAEQSVDAAFLDLGQMNVIPVTAVKLEECTRQDPLLSWVVMFTQHG